MIFFLLLLSWRVPVMWISYHTYSGCGFRFDFCIHHASRQYFHQCLIQQNTSFNMMTLLLFFFQTRSSISHKRTKTLGYFSLIMYIIKESIMASDHRIVSVI